MEEGTMAIEEIKRELEQRFDAPLDEFYKRRIIFWNDEDGDFKEQIADFSLSNALVLVLNETNQFESKRVLNTDSTSNYLVYNPLICDAETDWFLDIKLYSEEYRADLVSRWMQEMRIVNTPELRKLVKEHRNFFKTKKNRNVFASYHGSIDTRSMFYMSLLATICGCARKPEEIIRAILSAGPDIENHLKLDLLKNEASQLFWSLVEKTCHFSQSHNIDDLANYVVLSALSRTVSGELQEDFLSQYSEGSGFCYEVITDWIHSKEKESFIELANSVTERLGLKTRLSSFTLRDYTSSDLLPLIDELILEKLMNSMVSQTIDNKEVLEIIDQRKTSAWYASYSNYYKALEQAAWMNRFNYEYEHAFHHIDAKELWTAYQNKYYLMDQYYREFYMAFSDALQNIHPNLDHLFLDDLLKDLADTVENIYKNWFLDQLTSNWNRIIEDDLKMIGTVQNIARQTSFYNDVVYKADGKVFVIISDAMRYDVAHSLASELKVETKASVKLDAMQGIFPTITKFGMAALLPHQELSVSKSSNGVKVLVDGHPSEMGDREGLLQKYNKKSITVRYKDLIAMKRDESRALIKGKEIIYIYHDVIDASSHTDESLVFSACQKTIRELKNLVNYICLTLNGIHVLITSDHGFLYTQKPLQEMDKLDRTSIKKEIIEQGRRYVLTNEEADPDFLMEVKGIYNNAQMLGFTPREDLRLKGGGGLNFVHGGTSLQEMCVPVIQYKYLKRSKVYTANKERYDQRPVSIALLTSNRKISNMIFNLSFYQKEPVKENVIGCTYNTYLIDSKGNEISDRQKIIADKTNNAVQDREFKCTFNLKSQKFDRKETYYLVIEEENHGQAPIKEEFTIDIAMAIDEFDFFND